MVLRAPELCGDEILLPEGHTHETWLFCYPLLLTGVEPGAYNLIEKRGELRRLAATQNKQLNSSASSAGRTEKTSNGFEVPRCLARDFFHFRLPIADFRLVSSNWQSAIGNRQ
jgi:hypothetical protein